MHKKERGKTNPLHSYDDILVHQLSLIENFSYWENWEYFEKQGKAIVGNNVRMI